MLSVALLGVINTYNGDIYAVNTDNVKTPDYTEVAL